MAVNVISPGLSTTVQDLGRPGYYHLGIPISGGMDRFALRAANMLVGNDEGAAVLEAVFMGPELEFTSAATVAITGGDLPPKVNGDERPTWEAFPVKAGDRLSFGYLKSGARAYIAISGGVDVPVIIDLPQAVDAAGNNHAQRMLMRDVGNLRDFFGQFAPELLTTEYGPEIWSLYQAGMLTNDTPLTGRYERQHADVDMLAVLREIDDARAEDAARRLRMAGG